MPLKAVQMLLLSGSSTAAATGFVSYRWNWRPPHAPPPGYRYNITSNIHVTVTPPPYAHTHVHTHTTGRGRGSFSSVCLSSSTFSPLADFCPRSCRLRDLRALSTLSDSSSPSPSSSASLQLSTGSSRRINFCQWCGGPTKHEVPDGEEKMRAICSICGKIAYQNPKMVVGCLIEHDNRVLLCKRNIEPSYGLWTLPAGYMEMGESAAEGAVRETWEEAGAEVDVISPFAQLDIPLIGQTYVIFLAKLKKSHFSPGPESSECRLFAYDDIPFDSLAFSSMLVTLNLYIEDMKEGSPKFHYGTINKR